AALDTRRGGRTRGAAGLRPARAVGGRRPAPRPGPPARRRHRARDAGGRHAGPWGPGPADRRRADRLRRRRLDRPARRPGAPVPGHDPAVTGLSAADLPPEFVSTVTQHRADTDRPDRVDGATWLRTVPRLVDE